MAEEILEFNIHSRFILTLSRLAMLTGKNPFIFEGTPKNTHRIKQYLLRPMPRAYR
jgi:hypothetical protein